MSKFSMLPASEALQNILHAASSITETEFLPLLQASGRILARSVFAPLDVPPADNSAMDGFAFSSADHSTGHTQWFTISQRIAAGGVTTPLLPGTAARIFTGAEIPSGADSVVMQEHCEIEGDRVAIPTGIERGNNIRPAGQDITRGDEVVAAGDYLSPAALGLLASIGVAEVEVVRRLRVAILSTGDELVDPGQPLTAGKIYNSNRFLLSSLLAQMNIDTVDLGKVADNAEATHRALSEAASCTDVILSTGGVSVGEEDHVRAAVEALGHLSLWQLAIKPGKPLAFGTVGATPFIGLPGNPLSTFITFLFFARPYLQQRQGRKPLLPDGVLYPAAFTSSPRVRQQYILIRVNARGDMQVYPNQSSGILSSAAWANAVAIVPVDTGIAVGDPVEVIRFDQLF